MSGKNVYIEFNDMSVSKVFMANGYKVVHEEEDADIIVFTGGADICPLLYKEPKHPKTSSFNMVRDLANVSLYYDSHDKLKVGICRGAQFLNVMCGGSMYQHVENHQMGPHMVTDCMTGEDWLMTSCHHQMMIPTIEADILLEADEEQVDLVTMLDMGDFYETEREIEACYYPEEKCFCFQPHPEYGGAPETQVWFFKFLDTLVEQLKE